ncbi:nuclear transport factor 2 family protein [Sphingomonas sp.]|uniref:nuclear transport factor 2 family protein n=1 Tax=Sphingomonas sp. TaxID=28214 RepID=UPI002DD66498|nr:nuclear transport factor 2 family protein [Sphingomonas sp.]
MDRIEELLAIQDCIALMTDYNIHLDNVDADAFVALFTQDAVFRRVVPAEPALEFTGHAGLRRSLELVIQASPRIRRHLLSNARVTIVDDREARGFCIGLAIHGPRGTLPVPMGGLELVGEYRDTYRRTAEGWRIARRELTRIIDLDAVAG